MGKSEVNDSSKVDKEASKLDDKKGMLRQGCEMETRERA